MRDGIQGPQDIEALPPRGRLNEYARKTPQKTEKGRQHKMGRIDEEHRAPTGLRLRQFRLQLVGPINAMAQNSLWATGGQECFPALHELLELHLRLRGRTRVKPEASAMAEHASLLLPEFGVGHLR